jgi:hypothetical protein
MSQVQELTCKNNQGLKRLISVYSGMLYIGKKIYQPHESIRETTFAITCSNKNQIELTKYEALKLAKEILDSFVE